MTSAAAVTAILDAASIVLVDWSGDAPRILMGLRRPGNVFLPNKWVFPGGRLEASDAEIDCEGVLAPGDESILLSRLPIEAPPHYAKALALAAIRELFEETGYALASAATGAETGLNQWPLFSERRLRPCLPALSLFARAITPPGRPRRYDTRFFMASRDAATLYPEARDEEFADLNWFTPAEARALDLPAITRFLMDDAERFMANPAASKTAEVPFYYEENGLSRRDLLTRPA